MALYGEQVWSAQIVFFVAAVGATFLVFVRPGGAAAAIRPDPQNGVYKDGIMFGIGLYAAVMLILKWSEHRSPHHRPIAAD